MIIYVLLSYHTYTHTYTCYASDLLTIGTVMSYGAQSTQEVSTLTVQVTVHGEQALSVVPQLC